MATRTFLISGASKGIGLALATRLAKSGHRVVGIARNAMNGKFPGELVPLDLADDGSSREIIGALVNRYKFDGVINNVGLVNPAPISKVTLDSLDEVNRVNLHSAVLLVQAALPNMQAMRWGRIVNVSSLTVLGAVERTVYAGAKAALISFARTWALELAGYGITSNVVAPGPTETELFRQSNPVGSESAQRYLSGIPMGRFGTPDEIAATIQFLLSDDASFITGQTLFVDGGSSIGRSMI
jgi:3-oxoacyl-[acyl-carrier protein] reductase